MYKKIDELYDMHISLQYCIISDKKSLHIIEFVHQSPVLWLTDNIRGSAHQNIGKELVQRSIAKDMQKTEEYVDIEECWEQ